MTYRTTLADNVNTSIGCRFVLNGFGTPTPKQPVQVINLRAMQGREYNHIVGVIYSSRWSIQSLTGQSVFFWLDTLGLVFVVA